MDIYTAAQYMKHGYRVRRTSWHEKDYLKFKDNDYTNWSAKLEDLLATDWEVITENIRTHFNKDGFIEYNE